jgi:hypothetical protein
MIVVSLLFLTFISINLIINSVKNNNVDKYINDMEEELSKEIETTRVKDNKLT